MAKDEAQKRMQKAAAGRPPIVEGGTRVGNEELFHNTHKLLKIYRRVKMMVEMAVEETESVLLEKTGIDFSHLSALADYVDFDLSSVRLQSHAQSMEKNRLMLALLDKALYLMREYEDNGEAYYFILYYKHFCPNREKVVKNAELSKKLELQNISISERSIRHYYKNAVESLATILWGYTAKEIRPVSDSLLD